MSSRPPWAAATSDVDGQPEAGSAAVAAAALVEADEAPHDVGAPVGGDAGPVVVDVRP